MSRYEKDREDLLREATALVERIELQCEGWADSVVIGFRRNGEGSIFFGADPVFQFNSRLELRRGFVDGHLLKAEHGRLVSLERQRTADEVQLLRTELLDEVTEQVTTRLRKCLDELRQKLRLKSFAIVGQVPEGKDVLGRASEWLNALPENVSIAAAPNVK
jgi:hypothetical protein